jgi:hypothetical protein
MPLILKYTALRISGTPWPWWEGASRLQVCSMDAFARSKEDEVILGIESVANQFGLPLVVGVANKRTHALAEDLLERFVTPSRIIRVENLRDELNEMRPRQPDLQDGLIIAFDAKRFWLEDYSSAGNEPAQWGWTEIDGLVFLRLEPGQPMRNLVRHEMGHLLGIGWHHSDCVMDWACGSGKFCGQCKRQITKVCQVTH